MLSRFYQRHSLVLLLLVAVSLPFLMAHANSLPANNDIETWLPKASQVRASYERFKRDFGVEEIVLIGIDQSALPAGMVEAVCGRLDRLPGVRKCWSPDRMQSMMEELGVTPEEFRERVRGLSVSDDGHLIALVVLLSDSGLKDRAGTVRDIRRELEYCQLLGNETLLSGAPVIVTELDRLGGQQENQKFFLVTLLMCLGLLYYWTRNWKLSLSILGLTIWAINLTLTIFKFCGGEMNFILGALSVMVTVFTIEASIHVLHYHNASLGCDDPLGQALRASWKPCAMSMLTTAIGLFSVSVSDILPVTQFGYAAALGAVVSMGTGLVFTPAVIAITRQSNVVDESPGNLTLARLGNWLLGHSRAVVWTTAALTLVAGVGLFRIESKIDPLDFLPKHSRVLSDLRQIENRLTNIDSIEAVVDMGPVETPFVDRLRRVRDVEAIIRQHPSVRHTMSAATFFPSQLPDNPLELLQVLKTAESRKEQTDFVSADQRLWRISARIATRPEKSSYQTLQDLEQATAGLPVRFTGIAPLLQQAQHEIFSGFWQSFSSALIVILLVMVVTLWSVRTALLAIIPNLAPIVIVFGMLGWLGIPVDIGMMMTGSIVLGITVDGTFHFLARYQEALADGKRVQHATRIALMNTGGPIFESIIVSSLGMLALTLSNFSPTVRFGYMMAVLLLAALLCDLVLLPAMLCLQRDRRSLRSIHADVLPEGAPSVRLRRRPAKLPADKVA